MLLNCDVEDSWESLGLQGDPTSPSKRTVLFSQIIPYYQVWNRSPVQVGCMRQVLRAGGLGWPRGMGWGRRWEGGTGWGAQVSPWLIHVNVWQKPLQYCKVISLQIKKKRSVLSVHWKDRCWSWNSNTLATWWEELTHLKRPWCWERLKAGGEGDDRGWDGWMVSPTQWRRVWVNSGGWWWTGRPGMLCSMGSQRVGHNWATELNWTLSYQTFLTKFCDGFHVPNPVVNSLPSSPLDENIKVWFRYKNWK